MSLEKTATKDSEYQAHIENCKTSGLSVKAYSKQEGLQYDTFLYHYRKRYPKVSQEKLIAVRVKPSTDYKEPLCRVELRTGHVLWIRDFEILNSILPALL